jgi:hypothetical protein
MFNTEYKIDPHIQYWILQCRTRGEDNVLVQQFPCTYILPDELDLNQPLQGYCAGPALIT